MALIKTIAEIRALLPRISHLSDKANMPNMDRAAWKYIIPIIGQELYDSLDTAYNVPTPTLTEPQQKLLKHIQLPLAAGALLDELPFMHTTITDNGIRTPELNNMRASQKWEYQYLKDGLFKSIEEGQEILLDFLFSNANDYTEWTTSVPYIRINNLIIKNAREFDRLYKLRQPIRTFWSMESILKDVEENYLASRLGHDLLKWIKAQDKIEVTVNGALVNVKEFVLKAAAFLTIKCACEQRKVIFDHWGFSVPMGNDVDVPATETMTNEYVQGIYDKARAAERDGQNYLSKAAYYLTGIANGEFPDDEFGEEFNTAFNASPLYRPADMIGMYRTNGNEKRKGVFRLGS